MLTAEGTREMRIRKEETPIKQFERLFEYLVRLCYKTNITCTFVRRLRRLLRLKVQLLQPHGVRLLLFPPVK